MLKGNYILKSIKKEILRKQREEENYWNKYKDFSLNFNFKKLNGNKFSSE